MNKFWNWTQDPETGERELIIDRAIGISDDFFSWLSDAVTSKQFREELNSGGGNIVVKINSEGGDIFAANEIYNMLKEYSGQVRVKIDAIAASAASVIAMAGDIVEISPVGMIIIHNPWAIFEGDAEEFKQCASQLESTKEAVINAYERKTKLSRAELSRMMDEETYIHAQKAVELGFADKITGEDKTTSQENAEIFSRRKAATKIMNALRLTKPAEKKKSVKAASLRRRLNLHCGGKRI